MYVCIYACKYTHAVTVIILLGWSHIIGLEAYEVILAFVVVCLKGFIFLAFKSYLFY